MFVVGAKITYIKTTLAVDTLLQVQKLPSQLEIRLQKFEFLSAIYHHAGLSLYWRATHDHGDANNTQQNGIC